MASLTDLLAFQLGELEQAAKMMLAAIDHTDFRDSVQAQYLRTILARRPEDWQKLIDNAGKDST